MFQNRSGRERDSVEGILRKAGDCVSREADECRSVQVEMYRTVEYNLVETLKMWWDMTCFIFCTDSK